MITSSLRTDDTSPRIRELLGIYRDRRASAAHLLCDRHDPAAGAYRVVRPDLSAIELTYGQLREESERFAAGLGDLGIGRGDRVATLMDKSIEYLISVMAIWRLGAVHVPLFTAFAPPALALRMAGSAAKAVICDAAQQPKLAPGDAIPRGAPWRVITTATGAAEMGTGIRFADLVESHRSDLPAAVVGGDAPLIHIYTSGTTGQPKGVIVPVRALASFHAYAEYGLDIRPDDVFWNAADPGWAYGLFYGILAILMTGTRGLLVEGGFSAEKTLNVLARFGVTNFASAPTVFRALRVSGIRAPRGLKLRCASSAGEPLTPEVNEWAATALGIHVHDHYGQTETGMLVNCHHHPAVRRSLRPGSMGHPMPGWAAAILKRDSEEPAPVGEIGRIAIDLSQSPLAWFGGYENDATRSAEKFSPDGRWYFTGDVGRVDTEGYFYFTARDDDVIIMAGYRIGPFEVESALMTHPAVTECAVVAVPDAIRGEVPAAVVVLRPGYVGSPELTEELQNWIKSRYAAHAYPRRVHYATELPKTPSGKVQRFMVRQQLRGRSEE
jgi:acetyl-CoA synthetase